MSVIFICAVATTMLCIVNSKSKMDDKYKKEEKKKSEIRLPSHELNHNIYRHSCS